MATAISIVTDALKELCVLSDGETPTASMADDAFRALNRIMEMLSNDQAFAYFPNLVSRALTGETSFTIGPSGDIITKRPIRVESATVDRSGITYPVSVLDNQRWDSISYKTVGGANTSAVWYEAQMPNGIVHLWPVASGCTINLRVIDLVGSFANLSTDLILPPGYEEALVKNLAVNIAPQYPGNPLGQMTMIAAKKAMKYINRTNNVIPTLKIDSVLLNRRGGTLAGFLGGE